MWRGLGCANSIRPFEKTGGGVPPPLAFKPLSASRLIGIFRGDCLVITVHIHERVALPVPIVIYIASRADTVPAIEDGKITVRLPAAATAPLGRPGPAAAGLTLPPKRRRVKAVSYALRRTGVVVGNTMS
jgi:hypothetical protein